MHAARGVKTHGAGGGTKAGVSTAASGVPGNVGIEAEMSQVNMEALSFHKSSDIVFAFRLRKIAYDKKPAKSEPYNTGTILGIDDDKTASTEPQIEILDISENDVNATDVKFANKEPVIEKDEDSDESFVLIRAK